MPAIPEPMTLEEIRDLLMAMIDRGGDSELTNDLADYYINAAEQLLMIEIGPAARWLEGVVEFTVEEGETLVNMSAQVNDVFSVRDEANLQPLTFLDRQRFNAYIIDATETTGPPVTWTKFGFLRRINEGSPNQTFGQMQLRFYPVPTQDHTLQADVTLRAGRMVYDDDVPIVPSNYHAGLVEMACWQAGTYDVGSKFYQEHRELAQMWLRGIKRDSVREIAGSTRVIPREEYERRRGGDHITPPTRLSQLRGG